VSNHHTITKPLDHALLISELLAAGVTAGIAIDDSKIYMTGPVWNAMDAAAQTAELALVAAAEAAHVSPTSTKVTITNVPHVGKLTEELAAVSGVTELGVRFPSSYPGDIVIMHNSVSPTVQANLTTAAQAHDASAVPSLSVNTSELLVAPDGVATGTVVVTDSRGASANGKTVRLKLPDNVAIMVDADAYVMAGAGQATLTFGPQSYPSGACCLELCYVNNEADAIKFNVRFGTS